LSLFSKISSRLVPFRPILPRYLREQLRRLGLGCITAALLSSGWRLFTRDSVFAPLLHKKIQYLWDTREFDGPATYRVELAVLVIGVVGLALPPAVKWLRRFFRSWCAGITSVVTIVATGLILASLINSTAFTQRPLIAAFTLFSTLAILIWLEFWRRTAKPATVTRDELRLQFRPDKASEAIWEAREGDDSISDFAQDIIGRTAIVEQLALRALTLRTPIVALHGGLGDGKTSVLNLLRIAIEPYAIVVSFSAWLPGSEATLAQDLFRDIATECRKYVSVSILQKQTRAFARMVSGSVNFLGGIKEFVPAQSQREEIQELHDAISRVPKRVVVLLDEIDRMQKEELMVLLKILRGAASIPNVTFICAFSEADVQTQLDRDIAHSSGYLEKFFPVSINVSPPDPALIGRCFRVELERRLASQKWFSSDGEAKQFAKMLESAWNDSLTEICTNLRKAGLLINDLSVAAEPIAREVNLIDLVLIETLRRFAPSVYSLVSKNAESLTEGGSNSFFDREKSKTDFFRQLDGEIATCATPNPVTVILCWLFPIYARSETNAQRARFMAGARRSDEQGNAGIERRIMEREYFPIYFRAAVPEDMASQAEMDKLLTGLKSAKTEGAMGSVFGTMLSSESPGSPKRADLLWKLARRAQELDPATTEHLAYVAAQHAANYQYDIGPFLGEARYALNIVFVAAQELAKSDPQRVLETAMARASDDRFAAQLLRLVQSPDRNKILTDFSRVDATKLETVFVRRMQSLYGGVASEPGSELEHADWWAFERWAEYSQADRLAEHEFWRRFIGRSRKRLAQASDFLYPGNVYWENDPTPIVDGLFPLGEIKELLASLDTTEELSDSEKAALARLEELLDGKPRIGMPK
jgi:hypothetical protein